MNHASPQLFLRAISFLFLLTLLPIASSSPFTVLPEGSQNESTATSTFSSSSPSSFLANSSSLDVVRGVNLGGWLVLESWITPSVFNVGGGRNGASLPDEWSLTAALGKEASLSRLETHWESFFTRDDFVQMKAAGLNAVRIPVGYWAVDVLDFEPYVGGQFPYLIRAVQWAGEVGLKVLVGLHGAPGSQNGQDNSGLTGPVRFEANSSNIDRSLAVLKNLTAEFTQDHYGGVVSGISLLNEPRLDGTNFTMAKLKQFYTQASQIILDAAASNVEIVIHDAFWGPNYWSGYDPLSSSSSSSPDWLQLDTHQYYAFAPYQNLPRQEILQNICNMSRILKSTSSGIAPIVVGEWSLETGTPPNFTGTSSGRLTQEKRTWFRMLFEAQLAAYSPNALDQPSRGWYYWTWKTQYDIDTWSYQYGLENGYIPSNLSDPSTLAFPILEGGCIDAGFNYTAPSTSGTGGGGGGGSGGTPYSYPWGAGRRTKSGGSFVGFAVVVTSVLSLLLSSLC